MSLQKMFVFIVGTMCFSHLYAMGYSDHYEVCMKKAQNQSANIQKCQNKELDKQSKRLDKILKQTKKVSTSQEMQLLNDAQGKWVLQVNQACGLNNKAVKKLAFVNTGCLMQMTSSRADLLEVQLLNKKLAR
jgi:uncharacterized protein YecT (DUF1311 family)